MAAKRFFDDHNSDSSWDQPNQKRIKSKRTFASVIKDVVMVNFSENFCSALEPMLRRVVSEEVENGLRRSQFITKSPSLPNPLVEPSSLRLIFTKKLSLPIFTTTKIIGSDNNPLQVFLVDTRGDGMVPAALGCPLKLEIVVLNSDFPSSGAWGSEEFNDNIVKEREGKRPLLAGELNYTMREGIVTVGDIEFTDNSSWIRSRKFKLGVRVAQGSNQQGFRIREAITDAFMVKDHRGELYKKHHPPALGDEVWRLEKIGKDGAFHRKLSSEGIHTVQDFLKLSTVDPSKLRKILGCGMSEKVWEATRKHASTCVLGNKLYIYRAPNCTLILNPICRVVSAVINGQIYPTRNLASMQIRGYIEKLVRDAYANWGSLKEVEGQVNETALLTQGDMLQEDQYQNQQILTTCQRNLPSDASIVVTSTSNDQQVGYPMGDWISGTISPGYVFNAPSPRNFY